MNPLEINTIVLIIIIAIIVLIYFKDNISSVAQSIRMPKVPKFPSNSKYSIIFPILLILGAVFTVYYDKTVTLWAKDNFLLNLFIVIALLFAVIWVFQTKQTNSIVVDYFKIRKLEVTMAFAILYIMFAFLSVTIIFTYSALYESQNICHPLMYYLGNKRGCRRDPNVVDKTHALNDTVKNLSKSTGAFANDAAKQYKNAKNAYTAAAKSEIEASNKSVIAYDKSGLANSEATKAESAAALATTAYSSFTIDSQSNAVARAATDVASAISHANLATINATNANNAYNESNLAAERAETDYTDTISARTNAETTKNNAEQAKMSIANYLNTESSISVTSSAYRDTVTAKNNSEINYDRIVQYVYNISPMVENAHICANNARESANNALIYANKAQTASQRAENAKQRAENAKITYETNFVNKNADGVRSASTLLSSSLSGVAANAQTGFTNINPEIQSTSRFYSNSLARFQPVFDFFRTCFNSYETLQNRYFDAQEKTIDALTNVVFDPINTHILPFINKPVEKYLQ